MLERQLRDRFATGLNHPRLEVELKQRWPELKTFDDIEGIENEVSFAEVFKIALSRELAEKDIVESECAEVKKIVKRRAKIGKRIRILSEEQCLRCGARQRHSKDNCKAANHNCEACGKRGHYGSCCIRKGRAKLIARDKKKQQRIYNVKNSDTSISSCEQVFKVMSAIAKKRNIDVKIGSPTLKGKPKLRAYGNFDLPCQREATVTVTLNKRTRSLKVVVVDNANPMLFGLEWNEAFNLPLPEPVYNVDRVNNHVQPTTKPLHQKLNDILEENKQLFEEGLGKINNYQVKIHVKETATPIHIPARPVRFGIQKSVEFELERLQQLGIISPVDPNETPIEWATPTVNVVKRNGNIRICGDFRVTLNPALVTIRHPVPTFENIRQQLAKGEKYTKLDLRDAYLQFEISPESRKYLIISTHKGYFQYNRMTPGPDEDSHLRSLREVFKRLREAGFRIEKNKCSFFQGSIDYLGHQFNRKGIYPVEDKLIAIKNAAIPTNKKELRSFLGLVNFYEKFIPNLHGACSELHALTGTKSQWRWSIKEQKQFDNVKHMIASARHLTPYDHTKPLYLATDASDVGLGAVLYHQDEANNELPIAYASRKLNEAEQKYATIDKEALAIFFAVKKFDPYLRGTKFTLITDHKPLQHLLGDKRNLQKIVNNRLTRWALMLGAYNYDIQYHQGKYNILADCLSRLPNAHEAISEEAQKIHKIYAVIQTRKLDDIVLTEQELRKQTKHNLILRRVIELIERHWPDTKCINNELKPYYDKLEELSYENGILMWQGRIIVPDNLQEVTLRHLHRGHPGIGSMRASARYYVWWPNIDKDVEHTVKSCMACQRQRPKQSELPIYFWSLPEHCWQRLHVDFAGPFEGKMWIVLLDALSKWVEADVLYAATTRTLCEFLEEKFITFGYPEIIVSDNGSQFTSEEFRNYCQSHGIKHVTSSPYHPKTNGLAERFVRTFKERMKASEYDGLSQRQRLRTFLFTYRNTPHSFTGKAPSEFLLGRRLRTLFDNLKPNVRREMHFKHVKQNLQAEQSNREFQPAQPVFVKTDIEKMWEPANIVERTNRYSYRVRTKEGVERRRHADHILERRVIPPSIDFRDVSDFKRNSFHYQSASPTANDEQEHQQSMQPAIPSHENGNMSEQGQHTEAQQIEHPVRRSQRLRNRPKRLVEEM
ncbi:uncharacterized protein K02A2.6-like [Hermetia illucens]|uniref:uncharacterized protein K02A2.6-like n=1 Tax=Hermetia illucens TaxID=343691 RepID=UPI0018CC1CA4|nr:uncharacterized protein K02A2.6-like [Hermetia illucens]